MTPGQFANAQVDLRFVTLFANFGTFGPSRRSSPGAIRAPTRGRPPRNASALPPKWISPGRERCAGLGHRFPPDHSDRRRHEADAPSRSFFPRGVPPKWKSVPLLRTPTWPSPSVRPITTGVLLLMGRTLHNGRRNRGRFGLQFGCRDPNLAPNSAIRAALGRYSRREATARHRSKAVVTGATDGAVSGELAGALLVGPPAASEPPPIPRPIPAAIAPPRSAPQRFGPGLRRSGPPVVGRGAPPSRARAPTSNSDATKRPGDGEPRH